MPPRHFNAVNDHVVLAETDLGGRLLGGGVRCGLLHQLLNLRRLSRFCIDAYELALRGGREDRPILQRHDGLLSVGQLQVLLVYDFTGVAIQNAQVGLVGLVAIRVGRSIA